MLKPWQARGVVLAILIVVVCVHLTSPTNKRSKQQAANKWGTNVAQQQLQSGHGVYASTFMLQVLQQHMVTSSRETLPLGHTNSSNSSTQHVYSTSPLIVYPNTHHVFLGQGPRARAAFFVYMLAPRLILAGPQIPSMAPQLRMFDLAAAGLPAVGLLSDSEDPSAGYPLSCTSQGLQMALGLQPVAECTLYAPNSAPTSVRLQRRTEGLFSAVDMLLGAFFIPPPPQEVAKVVEAAGGSSTAEQHGGCSSPASWGLYMAVAAEQVQCCNAAYAGSLLGSGSSGGSRGSSSGKVVARWTVLPDMTPDDVAAALENAGAEPRPYLGGSIPAADAAASSWMWPLYDDEALVLIYLPRATLLRLLPGMGVVQSLLYGAAVLAVSYQDLLMMVSTISGLTTQAQLEVSPFLRHRSGVWNYLLLLSSITIQFMVVMVSHTLTGAWLAFSCAMCGLLTLVGGNQAARALACVPRVAGESIAAAVCFIGGSGMAAAFTAAWRPRPWTQNEWLLVGEAVSDLVLLYAVFAVWPLVGDYDVYVRRAAWAMVCNVLIVLRCAVEHMAVVYHNPHVRRAAWAAFRVRVRQELQQAAAARRIDAHGRAGVGVAAGIGGGVQAQVLIEAQEHLLADLGNTAEALRALADDLEDFAHGGGAGVVLQGGPGQARQLLLQPRPNGAANRGPRLGQHWPAALQFDFDVDDVRDELGLEVPRGFVCPLTLDLMRQPALLLSSNVAVPSSYEKAAISTWLAGNRRDPKSRKLLAADAQLVPNFDLYRAIEDWAVYINTLRQQREQQQAALLLPPSPAATEAGTAEAAGMVAGEGGGGGAPQRSTSTVTVSSLLAAAAGAVRGTAAAAVAAARRGAGGTRRSARQQQRQQQDDYDDALGGGSFGSGSDDEQLLYVGGQGGNQGQLTAEDERDDADSMGNAVDGHRQHVPRGRRGSAAAAAAAATAGARAGTSAAAGAGVARDAGAGPSQARQQQQQQQQDVRAGSGRYQLRQRSPSTPGAL